MSFIKNKVLNDKITEKDFVEVSLLPLPKVFLNPKGKLTLNIFEPRYLEMVQDSIIDESFVAPAHALPVASSDYMKIPHDQYPYLFPLVGYGCLNILHKNEDGKLIVSCQGEGKGIVQKVFQDESPYLKALVAPIEENKEEDLMHEFFLRRLRQLTAEKLNELLSGPEEAELLLNDLKSSYELVNFFSDHLVDLWPVKFQIFKSLDIDQKIEVLGHYLTNHQNIATNSSNL